MSIRKWYNAFKNGRTQLVDLQRAARRKTGHSQANVDRIKTLVAADQWVTVSSLAAQTGFAHSSIHTILKKEEVEEEVCQVHSLCPDPSPCASALQHLINDAENCLGETCCPEVHCHL